MYFDTNEKKECCGCTACQQICPKKCIKMEQDEEGFFYAKKIDTKACTSCGLCYKVCPFNNKEKENLEEPECYYGWHKDETKRYLSTSGAAFIALVESFLKKNYYYCGVVYAKDYKSVYHICTNNYSDVLKMRSSKYVQSNMNNCFSNIKQLLKNGEKVLFSGTPCQVYGLINYIGDNLGKNLFTVALVCHGVASPKCFEKYIDEIERKYDSKVNFVKFREKKEHNGELSHRYTAIKLKNGKSFVSTENPYTIVYGLGLMHRPSCTVCPYTTPKRKADITIGDFWGIEDKYPELRSQVSKGISLVLIHTNKGRRSVEDLKEQMELYKVPYTLSMHPRQHQLIRPCEENRRRERFIKRVLDERGEFSKEARREILRNKAIRKFDFIYKINGKIKKCIYGN